MKNLTKNINMKCPKCNNYKFDELDYADEEISNEGDNIRIKCANCNLILNKKELREGNQDIIGENIEDMKKEAINEIEKELQKMFEQ